MTAPLAAAMALLRPREMLAPGASTTRSGSRGSHALRIASVPSLLPPSQTTTSSGGRDWVAMEASSASTAVASLRTVAINETRAIKGPQS